MSTPDTAQPIDDDVSLATTDGTVAGDSVAVTEAEEDAASYANNVNMVSVSTSVTATTNREDASIAPTDASVAGSSVAATEADEDASSYAAGITMANPDTKVFLSKGSSLEITISQDEEDEEGNEEDTAPMHLHALRVPTKLKGVPGSRSRSSSRSRPGSRRNSHSPKRSSDSPSGSFKGGTGASDAASVASSLDEDVDPDILLDKFGFHDLDPNATQEEFQELLKKHMNMSGSSGLPTLNERMSEETMDDVHAFQELVYKKKEKGSSPSNSSDHLVGLEESESCDGERAKRGSANFLLNTLEEGEDEEEDENAASEGGDDKGEASAASSIVSGDDQILATDSNVAAECGDVVVDLPDIALLDKSIENHRDTVSSVMAVEDQSDNEEMNNQDQEDDGGIVMPTSVMEELRISDETRQAGQRKNRDTTLAVAVIIDTELDAAEGGTDTR